MQAIDLTKFDNDKFEAAKEFTPELPDGTKNDGFVVAIISTQSKAGTKYLNNKNRKAQIASYNAAKSSKANLMDLEEAKENSIEMAATLTSYIKNGEVTISGKEDVEAFLSKYQWLVAQINDKAQTDDFFFGIEKSE